MAIHFDYYKIFYYVARDRNITSAAHALYLTQPTVSRAIQNLEAELGCPLFARSKKGVALTPEGEILYRHTAKAFAHIFEAEEELADRKRYLDGQVRIGASEMTLHNCLLPYLEEFHTCYPSIKLKLANTSTPAAIANLKAGLIDFAVIASPIPQEERISVKVLKEFQDILIAGSQFEELRGRRLNLVDLKGYPIICMEPGTTTYQFWEELYGRYGLKLDPDIEPATSDLVAPMAVHNLGIGFCTYEFAASYLEEGTVFQLEIAEEIPQRQICIVRDREHPVSIAGRAFLKLMEEAENTL